MMKFTSRGKKLTIKQIKEVELQIGVHFPEDLRKAYLRTNGGEPDPYVFEDDHIDTVVSEFLPLVSEDGRETCVATYHTLVEKKLIPPHMMPFAIDGGGDFFLVDMDTGDGRVHFYRHDTNDEEPILNLKIGLSEFWTQLKGEDE